MRHSRTDVGERSSRTPPILSGLCRGITFACVTMSSDAAGTIAQVQVGVYIAMILEARALVGNIRAPGKADQPDISSIVNVLCVAASTAFLGLISLALCVHAVIAGRPVPQFAVMLVCIPLVLQLASLVLLPLFSIGIEVWKKGFIDHQSTTTWRIIVTFGVGACSLVVAFMIVITSAK
jgi:hypothetical protein